MKFTKIVGVGGCEDRNCPTVYETDHGTYVVQGAIVAPPEVAQLGMPANETVVEVPKSLLADLAAKLGA